MFAIIGMVVVLGAVIGGFVMAKGHLAVLWQPNEIIIIVGAAIGSLLVANPLPTLVAILKSILGILKGSKYSKTYYLEQLKMLNDLFQYARKHGMVKLEADVEEPEKSSVFSKYPLFINDHHALHFMCDTLRMALSGGIGYFELDQMMEQDMEVHHHDTSKPVAALTSMADALPGLGIVAAVLGVVITMGSLGGPPEEVGHHVAAALVGTFLGVLLCYGFFGPLAANIAKINDAEHQYYNFLRVALVAFVKGAAPILAVEFGRRIIPVDVRPSFKEMEAACKGAAAAAVASEAA